MQVNDLHPTAMVHHRRAPRARRLGCARRRRLNRTCAMARPGSDGCSTEENHRDGEGNSPVKEEIGDERDGRQCSSSGARRGRRRSVTSAAAAMCSRQRWRSKKEEEGEETVPVPYLWGGIPERFPIFPPTISTIVGGIWFVQRAAWRHPERPIRPHRGPHGPNGWIPDRLRLPAREPKRRRARAGALECISAQTGRRVGPGSQSRIHQEANGQDSLRMCYPVAGFASR